jgi:hypothetical protein
MPLLLLLLLVTLMKSLLLLLLQTGVGCTISTATGRSWSC